MSVPPSSDLKRYQASLRHELDGAALYTHIAAAETDPVRKDLLLQLAQAEAKHARARSSERPCPEETSSGAGSLRLVRAK
jgi:hypothetical protein